MPMCLQQAHGLGVGRNRAKHRVEAAQRGGIELVRLVEMVRRQDDDALVAEAGRRAEAERHEVGGQQMMRHA